MTAGFLLIDVFYLAGLAGLLVAASAAGIAAYQALVLPAPVALALALSAAAATWIFLVAVLAALLPRPRAGKYKVMGHPVFWFWLGSMLLRRYLDIPPLSTIILHSNVLRFAVMRLLGARVAFTTSMSSDVLLLDPALFQAGPGCVLGSLSTFAGHLVLEGRLLLAPIKLGRDVEVGGRAMIGPGADIGDRARIGISASLGTRVTIGAGATIGAFAKIDTGATVGVGATVVGDSYVPPFTDVPDGAVWTGDQNE